MELVDNRIDYHLKVVLDPPRPLASSGHRKFYTAGDPVTGTVVLTVKRQITVRDLQVKVTGTARTEITRAVLTRKGKQRYRTEQSRHEVLYDVVTLFPPQNVKEVSANRKFTLTPGEYVYEFCLGLPVHAFCGDKQAREGSNLFTSQWESSWRENRRDTDRHVKCVLPPSFVSGSLATDAASVDYTIKASLHRTELLATSSRLVGRLLVKPPGMTLAELAAVPHDTMLTPAIPSTSPGQSVRFELMFPRTLCAGYGELVLSAHSTVNPRFTASISLMLIRVSKLTTQTFESTVRKEIPLFHDDHVVIDRARPYDHDGFKYKRDISALLRSVNVSKVVPNFRCCNISTMYVLQLRCSVAGRQTQVIGGVVVSGPLLDEEERAMLFNRGDPVPQTPAYEPNRPDPLGTDLQAPAYTHKSSPSEISVLRTSTTRAGNHTNSSVDSSGTTSAVRTQEALPTYQEAVRR